LDTHDLCLNRAEIVRSDLIQLCETAMPTIQDEMQDILSSIFQDLDEHSCGEDSKAASVEAAHILSIVRH
jgi:hypothetical protein